MDAVGAPKGTIPGAGMTGSTGAGGIAFCIMGGSWGAGSCGGGTHSNPALAGADKPAPRPSIVVIKRALRENKIRVIVNKINIYKGERKINYDNREVRFKIQEN